MKARSRALHCPGRNSALHSGPSSLQGQIHRRRFKYIHDWLRNTINTHTVSPIHSSMGKKTNQSSSKSTGTESLASESVGSKAAATRSSKKIKHSSQSTVSVAPGDDTDGVDGSSLSVIDINSDSDPPAMPVIEIESDDSDSADVEEEDPEKELGTFFYLY
jgi:hypothetical protein